MSSFVAALAVAALLPFTDVKAADTTTTTTTTTTPPLPHAQATRAERAPVIDGRLDDAVWSTAPEQTGFTQKFPDERAPTVGRTSFRVLYDDDAIYFGIVCEQPKDVPIIARLTRRDRPIEADHVSVAIDARGDGRSAIELTVNAAGVLVDALRFDDTDLDYDWDETWDARVARTANRPNGPNGWSAEMRIPLRILRFGSTKGKGPAPSWGLQVRRYVSAKQETDEWAYIPRSAAGEVSRYGRLDGVGSITAGSGFVELRPFVLGRLDRIDPGTETLRSGTKLGGSAGIDAKWHARSDLTLDLTLLPDFAQVEADQLILNLTNEEIQLPEKRPFFFEGRDIFSTPAPLLYTRRIGRVAPARPELRAGEALVDPTEPATLLGATKLTGRLAEGLRVGSIAAITSENHVTIESSSATTGAKDRSTRAIVPRTLFQALRLRQELPGNATVGVFATAVARGEDERGRVRDDSAPGAGGNGGGGGGSVLALCPDGLRVPFGQRCTHDAYVGALDGRWRSSNGDWTATSQFAASAIRHGPERTFRDGTVVGDGDVGFGGIARVAKEGGVPWVGELQYDGASRRLDFNDLGYMQRQNIHHIDSALEYRTLAPWFITRETHSRIELYGRTNTDGLILAHGYQINTKWKLTSFWEFFIEGHFRGRHFDDREVGDGTALERRELIGLELGFMSDQRRVVAGELFSTTQRVFDGFIYDAYASVKVRALPQLELSLSPEGVYTFGEPRFADRSAINGDLIFGKLRATELSTTLRAIYTFTPRLSLQGYAQAFFAAGHYSDFGSFPMARAGRNALVHRDELAATAVSLSTNPDFSDAALNVNMVLRWEYVLGSTLYLVYTRTQSPRIELLPGQRGAIDFGGLQRAPATDTILIKLSYFFS